MALIVQQEPQHRRLKAKISKTPWRITLHIPKTSNRSKFCLSFCSFTCASLTPRCSLANLRRPETTDIHAFWYVKAEDWQGLIDKAIAVAGTKAEKGAMAALRKYEQAGLIMETDAGKAAPNPCAWCTRECATHECRVFAGRDDKACAYCKRMQKAGCAAAVEKVLSAEERLQQTVEALQGQCDKQEEALMSADSKIEALEDEVAILKAQMAQVVEKIGGIDMEMM